MCQLNLFKRIRMQNDGVAMRHKFKAMILARNSRQNCHLIAG